MPHRSAVSVAAALALVVAGAAHASADAPATASFGRDHPIAGVGEALVSGWTGSQQGEQQPLPTTYPEIRKLYEAGRYQEVVQAVAAVEQPAPPLQLLAGSAHEKLQQPVRASERYEGLTATPSGADQPVTDPWHFIGRSALLLNQTPKKIDEAVAAARRAVELAPANAHAHYQLGLALGNRRDYAGAAQAFEKTTEIDPAHAYAHYHAGLSYYQLRRLDQVARHFEAFLQLAPEAPERGQVMSVMRTIRG